MNCYLHGSVCWRESKSDSVGECGDIVADVERECDPGLEEAVKSIIFAAPRTEVKELKAVRELLVAKYGKEFTLAAMENSDGKVSERASLRCIS